MVWSLRNVVHSGVVTRLSSSGVRVNLIAPQPCTAISSLTASCPDRFRYEPLLRTGSHRPRGKAFLDSLLLGGFQRRHKISSHDIYQTWLRRNDTKLQRARSFVADFVSTLAILEGIQKILSARLEKSYRSACDLTPFKNQLAELNTDLLWSTVCVSHLEYPYILAAKDLGIRVAASILSFDNLTSRGMLPLFDYYLIWGPTMKQQLLRLYSRKVSVKRVFETGTPQFDYHYSEENRWSKQITLRNLGLSNVSDYFLYAASHRSLAPNEPQLVQQLIQRISTDGFLSSIGFVIRLHPLDDWNRWTSIADQHRAVVISRPFEQAPDTEGWVESTLDDQRRLVSTLYHAKACINIASTMSLDSAVMNRPVICIDFSSETDSPDGILYEEYKAEHYRSLVESDGIQMAHSWDELMFLLKDAITNPEKHQEQRKQMIAQQCGIVDGRAGERVVKCLRDILDSTLIDEDLP